MIRIATDADLLFIRDLQRHFTNAIGFIPRAAVERETRNGRFLIGTENDAEAGFLYTLPNLSYAPTTTAIIQTAVRMDAQRKSLGLTMVETIAGEATRRGQHILQAWCKQNLDANLFWKAAGFTAVTTRPGGQGNNIPHILWRKALTPVANIHILPVDPRNRLPGGRFARRDA